MDRTPEGEEALPSTAIDSKEPGSHEVAPAPPTEGASESSGPESRESPESYVGNGAGPHSHHSRRIMHESAGAGEPQTRAQDADQRQEPVIAAPEHATASEQPALPSLSQPHRITPDLRQQELVKGSHPGDVYVRYGRKVGPFRRKGAGKLLASLQAGAPRSRWGRAFNLIKRVLIGRPISTEHSIHERLTNVKALAVLSSDALSSVAYATEEILRILITAGVAALTWGLPLGLAVIVLMAIVVASYRQTIAAYPRGGGTYIVAKDNLGTLPGLAAAASILIGYTLTVAVSVAAGVAALYSIFPDLRPIRVAVCIGVILFITVANLRGLREAGNIFAVPTYLFIVGIVAMIAFGLLRFFFQLGGEMQYVPATDTIQPIGQAVSILLLLRAFTQGSAALTGVEAIADGVPAFKPPEASNARKTLLYMAILSIVMFGGITFLATQLNILPSEHETVVSQLARTVFGRNALWYFVQIVTALILVLAANTAFADFPRLSYFLARDKFMPHQFSFRGDRLAFSWGIMTLAVLACVLIIAFVGDTSALIPLYAIGVMGAFTFSQSGMVVRWLRLKPRGWQRNFAMNLVGAATTLIVFLVATLTKLNQGTWMVIVLIPLQMGIFLAINRHYRRVQQEVAATSIPRRKTYKHTFIVPVSSLNSVSLEALDYARSLSSNVTAVHIAEGEDTDEAEQFNKEWHEQMGDTDINLVIIESPYRSLIGPLLSYIDALDQQHADDTITIVLPEYLPAKPWEYLLHNQSALRLKAALLFRPNTVVADVPYLLGRNRAAQVARVRHIPLVAAPLAAIVVLAIVLYLLYVLVAS